MSNRRGSFRTSLRETETLFRHLADSSPAMIWMASATGMALWFNRAWSRFTGITPEQIQGFRWLEFVHPEDQLHCRESYRNAWKRQEPFQIKYRLRRYDGVYRWILDTANPRLGSTQTLHRVFLGHSGTCIDITEKQEAEQERLLYLKKQQHLLRDVLFSATEGRLHLYSSESELREALQGDASWMSHSRIELTMASLSAFRQEVRGQALHAGFSQNQAMDIMSAAGESAMNALMHGGPKVVAHIHISEDGSRLRIEVQDNGLGIDISELPRAVLIKGYSGRNTVGGFGHGFFLMLAYADSVHLLTGLTGTIIVLEKSCASPTEFEDTFGLRNH